MDPFSGARLGMSRAAEQLEGAAGRLARASDPQAKGGAEVDVAAELVNLKLAQIQQAAAVKVARTVSETLGRLVDTFA